MTKQEALAKFAAFRGGNFSCIAAIAREQVTAKFTRDELITFWNETKHLAWPENYGQSPWEAASCVGADYADGRI